MDLSLLSYGAATTMEPPPQPPHSPPPEAAETGRRDDLKTPRLFREAEAEAEEADPVVMDPKMAEGGVKYRECMRNHAASIGGHASDGCGEFMPGGGGGAKDGSLSCAACGCHRSFHRREVFGGGDGRDRVQHNRRRHRVVHSPPPSSMLLYSPGPTSARWDQKLVLPQHVSAPAPLQAHVSTSPPHPHHHHHHNRHAIQHQQQQRHNSMSGMISAIDLRDDQPEDRRSETPEREEVGSEMRRSNGNGNGNSSSSSKRFRTKFTAEQKEKMTEYAERTGWRIQRQDDGGLSEFCAAVGVKRNVLKVWMHNNKANALRRREAPAPPYPAATTLPPPHSAAATPLPPPPPPPQQR